MSDSQPDTCSARFCCGFAESASFFSVGCMRSRGRSCVATVAAIAADPCLDCEPSGAGFTSVENGATRQPGSPRCRWTSSSPSMRRPASASPPCLPWYPRCNAIYAATGKRVHKAPIDIAEPPPGIRLRWARLDAQLAAIREETRAALLRAAGATADNVVAGAAAVLEVTEEKGHSHSPSPQDCIEADPIFRKPSPCPHCDTGRKADKSTLAFYASRSGQYLFVEVRRICSLPIYLCESERQFTRLSRRGPALNDR
jgi:hypothetical protein